MTTLIPTVGLGLLLAVVGIINMTGNISSLHWYHRQRVSEDDKKIFGKFVGIGTILIGCSIAFFGVCSFLSDQMQNDLFTMIGTIELIVGIVVGLILNFYAMIKYNKGIF